MQSMSFDPIVADIGTQLIDIGIGCLAVGATASMSVTWLAPAGADEVSTQAGAAFTHIARVYAEVDEAAARTLTYGARPLSSHSSEHSERLLAHRHDRLQFPEAVSGAR